jgi:hypothetical protein
MSADEIHSLDPAGERTGAEVTRRMMVAGVSGIAAVAAAPTAAEAQAMHPLAASFDHFDAVVLHNGQGAIRHVHYFGTSHGGVHPTPAERERHARASLARASSSKFDPATLSALHVPPGELQPGQRYRVDVASKRLVPASADRAPQR